MSKPFQKIEAKDFPPLLKEIPDGPKHLYIEGSLPNPEKYTYLAVVGSRQFTTYGNEACAKIIAGLTGYPIVIVSGLAIGIDTIAHKIALESGLITVAFPGSGLDRSVLHPKSNSRLADQIVCAGGALVSEFDPTMPAAVYTFPARNRIMAGISKAILVIEAGEKSGTLITARLALDYNRDVFAIPGPIFSRTSEGVNYLIKQGATPISSSQNLLNELGFSEENSVGINLDDLSEMERKLIESLTEPMSRDDLLRMAGLSAGEAGAALISLELKGYIKERLGEIYPSF